MKLPRHSLARPKSHNDLHPAHQAQEKTLLYKGTKHHDFSSVPENAARMSSLFLIRYGAMACFTLPPSVPSRRLS